MTTTPNLGLTLMTASQAQKEVVFNKFLVAFDALFRGVVLSMTLNTPPAIAEPRRHLCRGVRRHGRVDGLGQRHRRSITTAGSSSRRR